MSFLASLGLGFIIILYIFVYGEQYVERIAARIVLFISSQAHAIYEFASTRKFLFFRIRDSVAYRRAAGFLIFMTVVSIFTRIDLFISTERVIVDVLVVQNDRLACGINYCSFRRMQ